MHILYLKTLKWTMRKSQLLQCKVTEIQSGQIQNNVKRFSRPMSLSVNAPLQKDIMGGVWFRRLPHPLFVHNTKIFPAETPRNTQSISFTKCLNSIRQKGFSFSSLQFYVCCVRHENIITDINRTTTYFHPHHRGESSFNTLKIPTVKKSVKKTPSNENAL